ncbi:peflin-like [Pollicipes pollicipes]|uniref:peflin-like n=1 Tax=Pollicipes pollicipes TaxID=41117 RepID=UPI0018854539|nr:peflin-like [Pollicipes pollicipes]
MANYPGQQPSGGLDPKAATWFRTVDRDNSGRITAQELQQALSSGNWQKFDISCCRMMIRMFDKDGNDTVDINEFGHLFNYVNAWISAFQKYDTNKSSSVDAKELQQAFAEMGYRLSPAFAESVLKKYDVNKSGQITVDHFILSCIQLQNLTNAFRARDSAMKGMIQIGFEDFLSTCFKCTA